MFLDAVLFCFALWMQCYLASLLRMCLRTRFGIASMIPFIIHKFKSRGRVDPCLLRPLQLLLTHCICLSAMGLGLARSAYIYTVYDRIFGDFPAKYCMFTGYVWLWPTLNGIACRV